MKGASCTNAVARILKPLIFLTYKKTLATALYTCV